MSPRTHALRLATAVVLLCGAGRAHAQVHDHAHMDMSMEHDHMSMSGLYGPYAMSREASGTAWQPEAATHEGLHLMRGPWMMMLHGYADLVYDRQGGPRGGEKVISDNMLMAMASRPLGGGTLGLRTMVSAEPATIGKTGYPLLLQTGETANGVSPLIDRQHPHDLFMELAGTWSIVHGERSAFVYAGLPGEPALGPPAFMHRFSGEDNPEAPISHHWLDSTHIAYGVVTLGYVFENVKLEGSRFRGREPDEERWNIETPKLDSHAFRATWNPNTAWSLQASHGRLHSPEQLEPEVNTDRTTLSAMLDRSTSSRRWQTTLAWGRNRNQPGRTLDALLLESALAPGERQVWAARIERVRKDELFAPGDPRDGETFTVGKASLSWRYEILRAEHVAVGLGGLWSVAIVPAALKDAYGVRPVSGMVFMRARLR